MQNTIKKISAWALIVLILLLIPFSLMMLEVRLPDPGSSAEVMAWSVADFIFAGTLLFAAGAAYILLAKNITQRKSRILIGIALFLTLAVIWGLAATGF